MENPLYSFNGGQRNNGSSGMNRSPLLDNTNSTGLRQRKKGLSENHVNGNHHDNGGNENSYAPSMRNGISIDDSIPVPPKGSISMGTGGSYFAPTTASLAEAEQRGPDIDMDTGNVSSTATSSRGTTMPMQKTKKRGWWVLVYGYTTASQYEEVLRLFESFGEVIDRKGVCRPGISNWVAFQYENQISAEKAQCHSFVPLSDGIFCGSKRLQDDEADSFFSRQQHQYFTSENMNESSPGASLFAPATTTQQTNASTTTNINKNVAQPQQQQSTAPYSSAGMEEKDILLGEYEEENISKRAVYKRSVCDEFVAWVFGW